MTKLDKSKFDDRQLIELIYDRVDELEREIRSNYVKQGELKALRTEVDSRFALLEQKFAPVQRIVYGMVGLVLTSVMGGLLALVITR